VGHVSRSAEGARPSGDAFAGRVRRALLAPWAPVTAVLVALGAAQVYAWPYTVDDAHIVARYAARLAGGQGYTFQAGPATDGVTAPLWLGLCLLCARAGADPLSAAKVLGAVTTLLATAQVVWCERRRGLGRVASWLVASLLATSLPLVTWSVAGLETGLATLALAALAFSAPAPALLAAGAVAWLRPELVPAALLLAGSRKRALPLVAACVVGIVSVATFRWGCFGDPWPMTAAAKPASLAHGLGYLKDALRAPASLALGLGAALAARGSRGSVRLALALVVHGLAVLLAGGDWMPAARLFAPVVPLALIVVARALARLHLRRPALACAVAAALLALRAASLCTDLPVARTVAERGPVLDALAAALPEGPGPLVALDIGWLGARVPGPILDLGGLTEPRIAYARGGHLDKHVDGAWLERTAPRALILHSSVAPRVDADGRVRWFAGYPVEQRVLAFPWVQRDYQVHGVFRYAEHYFYVLLVRRAARGR
jgi:hypothetical protein